MPYLCMAYNLHARNFEYFLYIFKHIAINNPDGATNLSYVILWLTDREIF